MIFYLYKTETFAICLKNKFNQFDCQISNKEKGQ